MTKETILYISLFFIILLNFFNKEKYSIILIYLTIPIAGNIFREEYDIRINLASILIFVQWLIIKLKGFVKTNNLQIKPKINFILFLIVYSVIQYFTWGDNSVDKMSIDDNFIEFINVLGYLLTIYFFVQIIFNYITDFDFQDLLVKIFLATSLLQFLSVILTVFGYSSLLPSFFTSGNYLQLGGNYQFNRYTGLLGDYELLVDYAMIIIAFSIVGMNSFGKLYLLPLLIGVFLGTMTGTRSFIIILIVFYVIFYLFKTVFIDKDKVLSFSKSILIIAVISILLYSFLSIFSDLDIIRRLEVAYSLITKGEYEVASNRDVVEGTQLVFFNLPIWGAGPFYFKTILNSDFVYHNAFLNIYAKYGILGIISLVFFLTKIFKKMFEIIKVRKKNPLHYETVVLIALLFALVLQQMKINVFRHIAPILIYCVLFIRIYSNYLRFKFEAKS